MTKRAAATCAQISTLPGEVPSRVPVVGMLVVLRLELIPTSRGPGSYHNCGIYSAHTPRCTK